MKVGEIIEFTYRVRNVIIKIIRFDYDGLLGELLNDYIGKNESWYTGDKKWFQSNLIKTSKNNNHETTTNTINSQ